MDDLIYRQAAITVMANAMHSLPLSKPHSWRWLRALAESALSHLESVQPGPLHINLNECVKVKLTDLGKDIYYHRYDELNKAYGIEIVKPSFPSEDKDGYTRFQLWEFIRLYGTHIGMGVPNVIDPLEIVVIDPLEIVYEEKINARTD